MKFLLLIYNDPALLGAVPQAEFNSTMRGCIAHAQEMRTDGRLIDSQMLENTSTAKSVRVRNGRRTVTDGPFAETKELLAGFNLIEAENMDEALRVAAEFPWADTGCIEVRPVLDIDVVRESVSPRKLQS
jgi:hypothetical protein